MHLCFDEGKIKLDEYDKTRQDKKNDCSRLYCQVIGDLYEQNNYGSAGGRVYSIKGLAPCLGASHFSQIKYVIVKGK